MADHQYQLDMLDMLDINETSAAYNYDYLEQDDLQMHPFVQVVGQVVFFVYIIVVSFGIPANIYVLWRMCRLANDDHEKYTNGTGVGLLTMATADLLSLILISVHNVLHSIPLDASPAVKGAVCKALLFSTHIVTSVSIWSWLLMSTLRYVAIRHPMFHLRLWRMPYRAIALIVFLSSLTNVWLLIAVHYDQSGCTLNSPSAEGNALLNRYLLLIESVWSFCIPVIMILYMDVMVLICRPRNFLSANFSLEAKVMTHQRSKKAKAKLALRKWLVISFIDVLLNTPENIYRLVVLLGMPTTGPDGAQYHYAAQVIAQVLYFAQFAFNSVYLALFVFDSSTKARPRSTATNYTLSEISNTAAATPPMSRQRPQSHREMKRKEISTESILIRPRRSSWVQFKSIISRAHSNEYSNSNKTTTIIVR